MRRQFYHIYTYIFFLLCRFYFCVEYLLVKKFNACNFFNLFQLDREKKEQVFKIKFKYKIK